MLRVSPVATAIRDHLLARSASCDDALTRACADLHWREMRIAQLEAELARTQREASAGYLRRPPEHPARALDPVPPYVGDEWIRTAQTGDAS
jgi:hypothetical protein